MSVASVPGAQAQRPSGRGRLLRKAAGLLLALPVCAAGGAADRLPAYRADIDAVTVSGVSSGGHMAVQFHVSHSSTVRGAGVLAGGPYFCARAALWTALASCMSPGFLMPLPVPSQLVGVARSLAALGSIDPIDGLAKSRVWLFRGIHDETVSQEVVEALLSFYALAAPSAEVTLVENVPAGHGMVTAGAGNACASSEPPFINGCGYDAAGALLAHLLGSLKEPAGEAGGQLVEFDQTEFTGASAAAISMADRGYVFVPGACANASCRVHVVFHGCRQGAAQIGERFVRESGYNRWAAANRLIILYPQAIARWGWRREGTRGDFVFNPRGCWDWWGYTGPAYHTRQGPQIQAVQAMVERLGGARSPPAPGTAWTRPGAAWTR